MPDPAVQKSLAVDLALSGYYAQRCSDVERPIVKAAKPHDAQPRYLLQTVPGSGKSLRLGRLYEMQDLQRVPRGQDCRSYCR